FVGTSVYASNLPSFERDFSNKLKQGNERVYDPNAIGIDSSKSLKENIRSMFYPNQGTGEGGRIWSILRVLAAGLFVGMIMYTGILFLRFPEDSKKLENAEQSLLYITYGGFLIFGSAFLVGLLDFEGASGSKDIVSKLQDNIFNIIAFMKGIAFFVAIVMILWYGFQIIQAFDAEDKRKKGITGVINVLSVLVFIKLLDFVYYIAQQQNFKSRAIELFVQGTKVIGYVLGGMMFLYLLYAGRLMVVSNGEDDGYKRAVSTLKTIFMVVIVIFLFLMIIYQLVNDLG
ncbi:MAG TPA: hypothetical protein PLW93_03695, partial [Candidatus Absconditabacterales bacterium]|nr:hypothetical protein [Candidatus Absconditabacterales bacterium]